MKEIREFIGRFIEKFSKDDTTTLAASLAFYTALSLAPILILFVTISSHLSDDLQQAFTDQARLLVGNDAAVAVEMVIEGAKNRKDLTSFGNLFGGITLLLSASLIFSQLRATLNKIFDVREIGSDEEGYGRIALNYVRYRILNMGFALTFVFALVISLLASSVISAYLPSQQKTLMILADILISTIFFSALFTIAYRYLPAIHLAWKRALVGGILSAILFVLGKQVIGGYLGRSAIGSSYGAAGSVIVLLAWVYYSALITFVGAQISALIHFTKGQSKFKDIAPLDVSSPA